MSEINSKFFDFVGNDPHLVIRPKSPDIESIDIYYNKGLQKFLVFDITEDVVIGKASGDFRETYAYILENIARDSGDHLVFNYPTTWAPEKKGRLLYEMDDAVWKHNSIKNLLLMLL